MALEQTRRIVDVAGGEDASRGMRRVNDLLQHGWRLISFYIDHKSSGKERREVPHYVLASDTLESTDPCQLGTETKEALMQQITEKMKEALGWLNMSEEERDRLVEELTRAITQGGSAAMALAVIIVMMVTDLKIEPVSIIQLDKFEKGFFYLIGKVKDAQSQIAHVSLSPPIPPNNSGAVEWEKAIETVLLSNKIQYRYVCAFYDAEQVERVKKYLLNSEISKFFFGHLSSVSNTVPILDFILVDDAEVITISPSVDGKPEVWVSIKHPAVVKMFSSYFQQLWNDSEKITAKDIKAGALKKILPSHRKAG